MSLEEGFACLGTQDREVICSVHNKQVARTIVHRFDTNNLHPSVFTVNPHQSSNRLIQKDFPLLLYMMLNVRKKRIWPVPLYKNWNKESFIIDELYVFLVTMNIIPSYCTG